MTRYRHDEDYVDVDFDELVHHTDGAVLIAIGNDKHWIPRSCLEDEDEVLDHPDGGTASVKSSMAEEKDLI